MIVLRTILKVAPVDIIMKDGSLITKHRVITMGSVKVYTGDGTISFGYFSQLPPVLQRTYPIDRNYIMTSRPSVVALVCGACRFGGRWPARGL